MEIYPVPSCSDTVQIYFVILSEKLCSTQFKLQVITAINIGNTKSLFDDLTRDGWGVGVLLHFMASFDLMSQNSDSLLITAVMSAVFHGASLAIHAFFMNHMVGVCFQLKALLTFASQQT